MEIKRLTKEELQAFARLKGCKSKKTGKTYDTTVIMTVDENQRAVFELNFEKGADKYGKSKNKKD